MKKILIAMSITTALLLSGCNSLTDEQKAKIEKQAKYMGKQQLIQHFGIYTDNGDTERANIFAKRLSAEEQMQAIQIFDKVKEELDILKEKKDFKKLKQTIKLLTSSTTVFKKWNYLNDLQKELKEEK